MQVRLVDQGTKAGPSINGKVRLEMWTVDRAPAADPDVYEMTPGRALALIEELARAVKIALTETVK